MMFNTEVKLKKFIFYPFFWEDAPGFPAATVFTYSVNNCLLLIRNILHIPESVLPKLRNKWRSSSSQVQHLYFLFNMLSPSQTAS
jgi:hypothetical protein